VLCVVVCVLFGAGCVLVVVCCVVCVV